MFWLTLSLFLASILVPTQQTFNLNGTPVSILIPSKMRFVQVTPIELQSHNDMSVLSYRVLIVGSERVGGLHWKLFVTNDRNKIVKESDWWDRGNWGSSSLIEPSNVLEYPKKSRDKITLLLCEVDTETSQIAVDFTAVEQDLQKILETSNVEGLKIDTIPHAVLSQEERRRLVASSVDAILKNSEIRGMLLLSPEQSDIFFLDTSADLPKEGKLKFVSRKQTDESIKNQSPISYFEFDWIESLGNSVTVVLNYHLPNVHGRRFIDEGVRAEVFYIKNGADYKFNGLKAVYF